MKIGKLIAVLIGAFLVLVSGALIIGSIGIFAADQDVDDYYVSDVARLETDTYAFVSESGEFEDVPRWFSQWFTDAVDLKMTVDSNTASDTFVGIGQTADVEAYLSGVAYEQVTNVEFDLGDVDTKTLNGTAVPDLPGNQSFWAASHEGAGEQILDWDIEPGEFTAVMMNADANRGVDADVTFGVRIDNLTPFAWILLGTGLAILFVGAALMAVGLRTPRLMVPEPVTTAPTIERPESELIDS